MPCTHWAPFPSLPSWFAAQTMTFIILATSGSLWVWQSSSWLDDLVVFLLEIPGWCTQALKLESTQCYPPELISGLFFWDMKPSVLRALSQSKLNSLVLCLCLTIALLTLQLFTEILSSGLGLTGHTQALTQLDSSLEQKRPGELLTWENLRPHVVQTIGGLAPASKSYLFIYLFIL